MVVDAKLLVLGFTSATSYNQGKKDRIYEQLAFEK